MDSTILWLRPSFVFENHRATFLRPRTVRNRSRPKKLVGIVFARTIDLQYTYLYVKKYVRTDYKPTTDMMTQSSLHETDEIDF